MQAGRISHRTRGAALVIGLVLLAIVTILAISAVNTATTELAMANYDQAAENAFQAAEAGLEIALGLPAFPTDATTTISRDLSASEQVRVDVAFDRATIVADRAFSVGAGSGVAAFHFVAEARASSARGGNGDAGDRIASAVHTQAFYIVGPQGDSL